MSQICVFTQISCFKHFELYPMDLDVDTSVFKILIKEAREKVNKREQILIHREDNILYYSYIYHVGYNKWLGIGLVHSKIIKDIKTLFNLFRTIADKITDEGILLKKSSKRYKLTTKGIRNEETAVRLRILLKEIEKEKLSQFNNGDYLSAPSLSISPAHYPIIDCLEKKGSHWFIERIKEGYHHVYIYSINEYSKPNQQSSIVDSLKFVYNPAQTIKTTKAFIQAKSNANKRSVDWTTILVKTFIGVIFLLVLFNLIAPWFIHHLWSKIAVLLSAIGAVSIIVFSDENKYGKKLSDIALLGGLVSILLATSLTLYGMFGSSAKRGQQDMEMLQSNVTHKDELLEASDSMVKGIIDNELKKEKSQNVVESKIKKSGSNIVAIPESRYDKSSTDNHYEDGMKGVTRKQDAKESNSSTYKRNISQGKPFSKQESVKKYNSKVQKVQLRREKASPKRNEGKTHNQYDNMDWELL